MNQQPPRKLSRPSVRYYLIAALLAFPWIVFLESCPLERATGRPFGSKAIVSLSVVTTTLSAGLGLWLVVGRIPVRRWFHVFGVLLLLALMILAFTISLVLVMGATSAIRGESLPAALPLFRTWLLVLVVALIYVITRWYAILPMVALSYVALKWAKGPETVA